jgi:hypothetical protein
MKGSFNVEMLKASILDPAIIEGLADSLKKNQDK